MRASDARWFSLGRLADGPTDLGQWIPAGDTAYKATDLEYVSDHTACRESIHGVAALVESGMLSGGLAGGQNKRAIRVVWYVGAKPVAVMIGGAHDATGQAELLAIARTLTFRR